MKIDNDKVVLFNYTLTNKKDGEVLDASNGQPMAYLHGHDNIIAGLESQMVGKEVGDEFTVEVLADSAYGDVDEAAIQVVERELFQGVADIEVGMSFEAQSDHGVHWVRIVAVDGDQITVDANHPLAGLDLLFDIEIMGIRDADADELEHGHAHGSGGHQH